MDLTKVAFQERGSSARDCSFEFFCAKKHLTSLVCPEKTAVRISFPCEECFAEQGRQVMVCGQYPLNWPRADDK